MCTGRETCVTPQPPHASRLALLFTTCLQEDLETGALQPSQQVVPKAGVGAPGSPEVAQQQPGPQLGRVSESGSPQQVVPPQQQQQLPPQPQAAPADPGELGCLLSLLQHAAQCPGHSLHGAKLPSPACVAGALHSLAGYCC